MRSLRQLAGAVTDVESPNVTEFQQTFLSPDVIRFAEENRFFMQAVKEYDALIGTPDKTLRLPLSTGHETILARTPDTAGTERTYTEMSKLDTVDLTPTWKLGGVAIDKALIQTSRVDLIEEAKFILAEDIIEVMETDITAEIDTSVTTNVVYGGDAVMPDDLQTGDKITIDLVADAIDKLGTKWKAALLFIGSAQRAVFHKSSQFTNAAEYGSNEVVLNGEIGKYLGVKIIETDLVQHYAANAVDKRYVANGLTEDDWKWGHDNGGVAGTSCQLIGFTHGGRKPIGFAWKEKPNVDYEYSKRKATHYLLSDVAYEVKVIHEAACCLIKVTDA